MAFTIAKAVDLFAIAGNHYCHRCLFFCHRWHSRLARLSIFLPSLAITIATAVYFFAIVGNHDCHGCLFFLPSSAITIATGRHPISALGHRLLAGGIGRQHNDGDRTVARTLFGAVRQMLEGHTSHLIGSRTDQASVASPAVGPTQARPPADARHHRARGFPRRLAPSAGTRAIPPACAALVRERLTSAHVC